MDQTRACSKSSFGLLKPTCDTRVIHFDYYARAALAWTKKKCSLRIEKLKANRASETEEQIKERLTIRRENEKIEKHEKQRLATTVHSKLITPHAQRERGKVIRAGVHIYICGQKKI